MYNKSVLYTQPEGQIFSANQNQEIICQEKKGSGIFRPFLTTVSLGLFLLSVIGLLAIFWPAIVSEYRYRQILSKRANDKSGFGTLLSGENLTPPNTTFSIIIPKIEAVAPVIANVETADENQYMDALKNGVAHAKGTCFPGMGCRIYLFAHSTSSPFSVSRYNAVFYLLKEMETDDTIIVYYLNQKFIYKVVSKGIYPAEDMEYLVKRGDHEELVLQTCDPPGTSLNRLLIFAEPTSL